MLGRLARLSPSRVLAPALRAFEPQFASTLHASSLLLDDYEEYAKNARLMTSIHAAPKTLKETDSNRMQAQKAIEKGKQAAGVKKPKRASLEKKKSLRRL